MSLAKLLLKRWREEHGFPEPPPSPAVGGVKREAPAAGVKLEAPARPVNPLLALARTLSSHASEPDRCARGHAARACRAYRTAPPRISRPPPAGGAPPTWARRAAAAP
jgi:hypothetical protein